MARARVPKMAEHADNEELKEASRRPSSTISRRPRGRWSASSAASRSSTSPRAGEACEAIEGLIREGEEVVEKAKDAAVCDAGMIAAGQATEHYEIARCGTLVAWAEQLGLTEAGKLLGESLAQEKEGGQDAQRDRAAHGQSQGGVRKSDVFLSPPRAREGTRSLAESFQGTTTASGDFVMGRGLILWLVGIPLPVILILYFLGYLH